MPDKFYSTPDGRILRDRGKDMQVITAQGPQVNIKMTRNEIKAVMSRPVTDPVRQSLAANIASMTTSPRTAEAVALPGSGYTMGAFYCPIWSTPGGGPRGQDPWSVIPDNRVPLGIGRYDEADQGNVDFILRQMREAFISFVAIEYFMQAAPGGKVVPVLDHFLQRYHTSRIIEKPNFCLMFECRTNLSAYTPANWSQVMRPFLDAFASPHYQQFRGKPMLLICEVAQFIQIFGNVTAAKAALNQLRAAAVAEGHAGVHIVGMHGNSSNFWMGQTLALGCDGITSYNVYSKTQKWGDGTLPDGVGAKPSGFARMADAVYGPNETVGGQEYCSWFGNAGYTYPPLFDAANPTKGQVLTSNAWAGQGLSSIIPPIMTGFGPHPWAAYAFNDYPNPTHQIPTFPEWEAHLLEARSAIDAYRHLTDGFGIVVAWNEFGEGSYLMPTAGSGYGMINCFRRIFGY